MPIFQIATAPQDLSLPLCVTSGQVFRWKETAPNQWEGVDGDSWYQVQIGTETLQVESNGSQESFERLFRLDWNGNDVRQELVRQGPELEPYIKLFPGLRVMRPSDPVETLFCFMCSANNHLSRITSMIATLAGYGRSFDSRPHLSRFPTVDRIAEITEAELRTHGFGYRGATIPRAAGELVSRGGKGYLQDLARGPYEQAHKELGSIFGIGPKLADCIALFGLDHTSAVPIDTHIWQAATRLYFPEWQGAALTASRYKAVGDHIRTRFGPLAGWAQQYLFYANLKGFRTL